LFDASVKINLEAVPELKLAVPLMVVVMPLLPKLRALVLVPPIVIVPFASAPAPASIVMFPEVPVVVVPPVWIDIFPELPLLPAAVFSVKPFPFPVVVIVPPAAKVALVPMVGVVMVGLVPNTATPEPVSSEREEAREDDVPLVVNCPPVVVKSARSAVKEEKVTAPDAFRVVVDTPVAPVMLPAPVMAIDGEERKLVKPVPKVNALKVLLVCAVTFPKFTPVMVLAPVVFAVPVRLIPSAFTAVVPLDAVSVALNVAAVPVLLVYVCVSVPVPLESAKFLFAATVVSPLRETAPVPVANVPLDADWSKL
jgi:hypothetical protein